MRTRSRALIGAVAILIATGTGVSLSAWAQDASDEIKRLQEACDGGDANSCNDLGVMYSFGQDVEIDDLRAAAYFEQACDGGEINGCSNLGNMYMAGEGVDQDYEKAVELYQMACDGGSAEHCATLGWAYLEGDFLAVDEARATENFAKACDGGDDEGCFAMGVIHEEGIGVPEDVDRAIEFYVMACDSRSSDGCAALGDIYTQGLGVDQDMERGFDYLGRACITGLAEMCNLAADAYENGGDVAQDQARAVRYHRRSCGLGDEEGCANLNRLFPGESCPCFDVAEIMSVCPRPDADATETLVQTDPDGSRRLSCLSTRNYSPGSIMFDVYAASADGRPASCFVQSVEVEPYGSGGSGLDLTPAWLAGCIQTMDDASARLGVELTRE